jgi:L-alanine-DL-glutamate epimerase-like enolase superfamily enzyme
MGAQPARIGHRERSAAAAPGNGSGRPRIEHASVAAYRIPTERPEADGTRRWDSTTMIAVHVDADGITGFGYTYGDPAVAAVIQHTLAGIVCGRDAFDLPSTRRALLDGLRHSGLAGVGAMALSALDQALWDLKARLLDLSLLDLWGASRDTVPLYASGGFTSYSEAELAEQLAGWAEQGFPAVKMKVGSQPQHDPRRVDIARRAIGPDVQLMVDANGAYARKQALALAESFAAHDVSWFEEPLSSDDLDGLRLLRDRAPAPMVIAAGEYGWSTGYFNRMLNAGAVDVLQADGSRCGGYSGLFDTAALCRAHGIPLSLHCVPGGHAMIAAALPELIHVEYFHDHARVEDLLLEGLPALVDGQLVPDRSRPGHGLRLRRSEAGRYRV